MVDRTDNLHRPLIGRSPTTIQAANTSNGYGYGSPTGNQGGWFSGLRQKISQLTGMSEWLNQLGIGNEKEAATLRSENKMTHSAMAIPSTSDHNATLTRSHSLAPGEGYDDGTGFSFQSISLEDCPSEGKTLGLGWMDFSPHSWSDTIERQHFGPLKDLLTIGGNKKGQGHEFKVLSIVQPTWCDKCGDFILFGFDKQAVKCKLCNYTCHDRCQQLVTLDCRSTSSTSSSNEMSAVYPTFDDGTLGTIPKGTVFPDLPEIPEGGDKTTDSDKENGCFKVNPLFVSSSSTTPRNFAPFHPGTTNNTICQNPFRIEEFYVKEDTPFEFPPNMRERKLEESIEKYNEHADGLGMKMGEDGESFTGYLHIHMNFTRPINVVAGEQPPTMYDVVNTTGKSTLSTLRTITSFFLPRNTVKTVNITSQMTTREMIVTLLRKFRVADNPRKFALYECDQEMDEANHTLRRTLTRIADECCPLQVALQWGSPQCGRAFVLQENDTGDILWDAFEVPELENFLRILSMEEQQYNYQIRQKFNAYRYYLDQELRGRGQSVEERASAPPLELAPPPPPPVDYYGTSDSMVFHTVKDGEFEGRENPIYMNLSFLQENMMDQSTKL